MTKYIVRRVLIAIFIVFIVATMTFFIMKAVPGSPFTEEKTNVVAEEANRVKYGLDKPVYVQYGMYLEKIVKFDFGETLKMQKGTPVLELIKTTFPISAGLGGMAILFAIILGVPLGCIGALKRGKLADNIIRVIATAGIAMPSFVVATVGMIIFSVKLKLLPSLGLNEPAGYILPIVSLGLYPMCYIARLMRSSMLETIGQDYIRTAKAKGIPQSIVIFKNALKNSLLPVITYMGPMIAYTLTGSFVVEKVFNIPGLGRYFINSISNRDYPIIMGMTIFIAALIIFMNLISDIIYKIVDPRIRLTD